MTGNVGVIVSWFLPMLRLLQLKRQDPLAIVDNGVNSVGLGSTIGKSLTSLGFGSAVSVANDLTTPVRYSCLLSVIVY